MTMHNIESIQPITLEDQIVQLERRIKELEHLLEKETPKVSFNYNGNTIWQALNVTDSEMEEIMKAMSSWMTRYGDPEVLLNIINAPIATREKFFMLYVFGQNTALREFKRGRA